MPGGMHPDYTHRRVHFSCLFEEKLEGSMMKGDQHSAMRVVFSLLDDEGKTIELDPDPVCRVKCTRSVSTDLLWEIRTPCRVCWILQGSGGSCRNLP
jgi:hypothetical protein